MLLRLTMLLVAAAIAAAGATSARAQQSADTGRVLTLDGRVSLEHGGELWALAPGQTVSAGQVVVTGPDGYSQLELSDHSIMEVFPNSRLVFRPSPFSWKDLVDIYLGKIRLQIQHLTKGDSPYRVTSPTAVISIRGTVLDVEVGPGEDTTVQVETGTVSVRHRLFPGKEVMVETGQTLRVVPNVPLAAAKPTSPLVVAGRIARVAGETAARMGNLAGRVGGGGGGSVPKPPAGGSGSAGSSAGANQPKPPPGQDGGGGGGTNAPPGDVIH
jgi:ferric-dicitrate binding protein FerR (iron transport regulator)